MSHRILILVLLGLYLIGPASARADDVMQTAATTAPAAATANVPQTLELGTIKVVGKLQVQRVLATIKQALNAPDSTDSKHRDDLVCRFVHDIADPRTYLDCATNATNQQRRNAAQVSHMGFACKTVDCAGKTDQLGGLNSLVATQPDGRLHVRVQLHDFRELLESVTVAPPTTSTPAASTADPTTGHD
jgi:hypothetical protein